MLGVASRDEINGGQAVPSLLFRGERRIITVMLETYGFFAIVLGLVAAVIGYVWLLVRGLKTIGAGPTAALAFPLTAPFYLRRYFRAVRGPVLLLTAAGLLIGVPYGLSYYERHFLPLRPYEQIVDGELRVTLTGLKDFDYSSLAARPDIVVLQMANADVDDRTLQHLRGLTRLRKLDVADTQITDAGLAAIAALPTLAELYLSRTQISDEGFQQHLGPKSSLQKLDLTGTAVKGKTKRDWKKQQPDVREYVD